MLQRTPMDNKKLYQGAEFENWAYREKLIPEEEYLIKKYLQPHKKTVEAGTAGGKILFGMQKVGFTDLHGYDYVPEFIQTAIARDPSGSINFEVQDATSLQYETSSFEQIVYLQQIISSIDFDGDRLKALHESYRILNHGGTGLFSFLNFEVRSKARGYSAYVAYLKLLRAIKKDAPTIQHLPWMRQKGRFNKSALLDRPPYTYWYCPKEIVSLLQNVGFTILAVGTSTQIKADAMLPNVQMLNSQNSEGMLYIVVTK